MERPFTARGWIFVVLVVLYGLVQFYTKVTFAPARGSGTNHRLLYKWYTGDVVSLSFPGEKR